MIGMIESGIKSFIAFAAVTIDILPVPAKIIVLFMLFLHSAYEKEADK